MTTLIDLEGQTAVVTGAAQGIGLGIASGLGRAGATVILGDIAEAGGEAAADHLRGLGLKARFAAVDVSNETSVKAFASRLAREVSGLNVLVNNAGVAFFAGIQETDLDAWNEVIDVDLRGPYLMTRHLAPLLKQGAPAAVINIASVHALMTVDNMAAYAAAKGGVVAMVRSMAQEFGPAGVRVNAISPGFVDTPLYRGWRDSQSDPRAAEARVTNALPLRRIGHPDEIGDLTAFLCSPLAASITGANFVLDSGLTTRLMH
jgi:NAD(P)-dependent dehydrogenase (short-subunit alcohol dehydrogenase family)